MFRFLIVAFLAAALSASADEGTCTCSGCFAVVCSTAQSNCASKGGNLGACVAGQTTLTCGDIGCDTDNFSDLTSTCNSFCFSQQSCTSLSAQCSADNTCLHEDTIVTYKGKNYSLKELEEKQEPECQVPHTPASKGLVIATSCGKTLRVTDTHLVATTKGFQTAISLQNGDTLFGDFEDTQLCVIESIEKEKTEQKYFGLNCVHSEVLADGIRVSTFGDFHTLPSWYMYYAGNSWGSQLASKMGSYVAEWYYDK